MIPDFTALILLLGLVPGWVYLTEKARRTPERAPSQLQEVLHLAVASVAATLPLVFAWSLLAVIFPLPGPHDLLVGDTAALTDKDLLWLMGTSVTLVVVASLAAQSFCRRKYGKATLRPHLGPLVHYLASPPVGECPPGNGVWATVTLTSGDVYAGKIGVYPYTDQEWSLSLVPPIRGKKSGQAAQALTSPDALIFRSSEISLIALRYS